MENIQTKKSRKRKLVSWDQKRKRLGYIFVSPFLVGAVLFLLIPAGTSLLYSFCDVTVKNGLEMNFVGWDNFNQLLFVETGYRKMLLSSMVDMLINVPIVVIFSFFIASILNGKFHGRSLVRGIFFLPVILSAGAYVNLSNSDQMTQAMAQGGTASTAGTEVSTAFVNMLSTLNMDENLIAFLTAAVGRISTIVAMSAIPIVIFLAGFQSISPTIFEAAYMEGATQWEVFWKISFPMVSSLILVSVIYTIIDAFTNSSSVMINNIHNATFTSFNFGRGSAMAWIYLLVVFIVIGIVYKLINKHIFYYD